MSPNTKTIDWLRKRAVVATVVEQRHGHFTRDLFGMWDILALDTMQVRVVGIQTTTKGNGATRIRKIAEDRAELAWAWFSSGGCGEVWEWNGSDLRIASVSPGQSGIEHSWLNQEQIDKLYKAG